MRKFKGFVEKSKYRKMMSNIGQYRKKVMLKTRKCVRITEINKLEFAKEEDLCVFGKQYLVC